MMHGGSNVSNKIRLCRLFFFASKMILVALNFGDISMPDVTVLNDIE